MDNSTRRALPAGESVDAATCRAACSSAPGVVALLLLKESFSSLVWGTMGLVEVICLRELSTLVETARVLRRGGERALKGEASGSCVDLSRREARVVGFGVTSTVL